jgi:flagellar hook-basal body protein
MSLFGAMNSAISGLNAQSNAFGNISDNVANAQTIGFKRVDTAFVDFLTTSTPTVNAPGAVVARPDYVNDVQGAVTQTDNPLGLAIAGQGFFAVSQQTGQVNNLPTFNPQQFYTRAGDFQMNKNGYLVNSAGQFLNGWSVDAATQVADENRLAPIQVSQTIYNPVATSQVDLSANLPATPANPASPVTSLFNGFDTFGMPYAITLNWVQSDPVTNTWTVSIKAAGAVGFVGAVDVDLGTATQTGTIPSGTLANLVNPQDPAGTHNLVLSPAAAGTPATISLDADFGGGVGSIQLDLGNYGSTLTTPPTKSTAVTESPITSQIDIYDALGTVHPITLDWAQTTDITGAIVPDDWKVSIYTDGSPTAIGTAEVQFGQAALPNVVPAGAVGKIIPGTGVTTLGFAAGTAAKLSFNANFGSGVQPITLNLGTYGETGGVTQYAGTEYNLRGLSQDGVPPGSFAGVTTQANGNIQVNYDNGQTRTIAKIPLITFNNPNALQRQNGQAFTATLASGNPLAEKVSTNGAGNLVVESLEGSNVDIATEFTKLIVAQRAYSANTKVVTTADELLQQTIDMKR